MKFAEHLLAHITPEWRKQYIHYEEMKAMLYTAVEEAPSAESVGPEMIARHFSNFDEVFFQYCDKELKKINTFYSEKLAEATRKSATLRSELQLALQEREKSKGKRPARKLQDLKLAFSEFYLSLVLLQNYQNLNYTGFRKILKKHDKLLSVDSGTAWRVENVETSHFFTNKDVGRLVHETEGAVTTELEGGDRQKAMKRLRVPPLGEKQSPWITFKVGLFSGSFIILLTVVILSAIFHQGTEKMDVLMRLYRGPLLLVEFMFLMGVNVYGWRSSGVNHVLIFELDPRHHLTEQHIMEMAAVLGVVGALSVLSFLYASALSIPPYVNPLALVLIMFAFALNPLHTFRHEARFWFLRVLGRMLAAPFFSVGFADFWLADQLNSLATVLVDFHFLVCFYLTTPSWMEAGDTSLCSERSFITKPIVNCIPAWIRFAQCLRRYRDSKEAFPHLVNAGKYSTTFFVVIFSTLRAYHASSYPNTLDNPYFYPWLLSCIVNSCYTYAWDVKMDWGFFDTIQGENKFLREETVYSSNTFYYFAIVEDFVLRWIWALGFFLTESKYIRGEAMQCILAPLEVFRRFVWNFFRLENEHLNNCGKFRAVRDISVAPLESSDQLQILRMMDDENGVVNRHVKKRLPPSLEKEREEDRRPILEDLSNKKL
ncbi:Xenotropic and polytropic retrovirus receptor 1 [Frankliniella fusca]|uniref:Xenotropic and polytropic retrovirus receptor 1 n=1 Tax=Frankliniella fusca TaxID=407009 RepID=A0AAE1HVV0_9NEOP|nr:Xenotropic and polytropic retrovirus receptor 1 [Frankliniella fusca]